VSVQPAAIHDILVLPGETEAWQDVVVSADVSGRVEWIGPQEGDPVKKGDLLARIDVSALKAELDRTEAAFNLADDLYQRRKQLHERKIIHQEALEQSLTDRNMAQSTLAKTRVEYERGFPKSPITGKVNYLHVDEGEFIDRGKALASLVNVDRVKVNVHVPELDIRYLKKGQKAQVSIDALPKRKWTGTIDYMAYKADPATKTFPVRVLVDNQGNDIRPGMIARLALVRRVIPDALSAPLFAIVSKEGERLVFVEKDGVVHARSVAIGVIEGDRAQITDGIEANDRLIVSGQTEVEEGMKVQVQ
jgi:membrane fusion protein (multidrug efflux system)